MNYVNSINNFLNKFLKANDQNIIMGEDILDPYGGAFKVTKGLSEKYRKQVYQMPISEAMITGIGTGLMLKKHNVISEIMFGDFLTLCSDQIINGISKFMDLHRDKSLLGNYILRTPMGGYRGYGPTHSQSLESIFLNVPNINIFSPNIFSKPENLLDKILILRNFSIFIEHKVSYPKVINPIKRDNFDLKITNFDFFDVIDIFNNKPDYVILTYGYTSEIALDVIIKLFLKKEMKGRVISLKKLKPIDYDFIKFVDSEKIIILEEGISENGWGIFFYKHFFEKKKFFEDIIHIGSKNSSIPSSIILEKKHLPSVEECVKIISERFFKK